MLPELRIPQSGEAPLGAGDWTCLERLVASLRLQELLPPPRRTQPREDETWVNLDANPQGRLSGPPKLIPQTSQRTVKHSRKQQPQLGPAESLEALAST